jgi:hypothetical protein
MSTTAITSNDGTFTPEGELNSHYLDFRIIWTCVVRVMSVAGRG